MQLRFLQKKLWLRQPYRHSTLVSVLDTILNFGRTLPILFLFLHLTILVKTKKGNNLHFQFLARKQTFSIHREVIIISRDFYALKNLYTNTVQVTSVYMNNSNDPDPLKKFIQRGLKSVPIQKLQLWRKQVIISVNRYFKKSWLFPIVSA